ncbi:MAG: DNA repair exonuclease [Clostridia bacterium]|nr:DNA repair exonuclease [Clostridia bacterium]
MKFVHIADMHFDTPFTLLSDRANLGEVRRLDQRKAFKKMIEYIKINEIPYLFIAGDLYDHEYVRQSTIDFINDCFKQIPNTIVFITPGNHDPYLKNSYYAKYNWNENVKIFTSKIEKIETKDFDLYGYGFEDFYLKDSKIEEINIENKEKLNILITHASLDGGYDDQRQYNTISSSKLRNLEFNYVALGHIHKINLSNENKNIIYPGSTISLGFDELDEHGMIVGNIEKEKIQVEFIKLDDKEFKELKLDITNINQPEELLEKIQTLELNEKDLYKIILIGNRNFEINAYKLYKQIETKNIIKIKDKTKIAYDLNKIANNITLKGIFAQEMLNQLNNENIDKEIIEKSIEIGIEALS